MSLTDSSVKTMNDKSSAISAIIEAEFQRRGDEIKISSAILESRRPEIKLPYLMVSPDVSESDLHLDRLAEINRVIVGTCMKEDLLNNLAGLEILSRVVRSGIAIRIVRLTILDYGLNAAEQISATDLKNLNPFPGVHSFIYMKNISETEAG
jgi:hypothetical protein